MRRLTAAFASVVAASTVAATTTAVFALSSATASAATLGQAWYAQAPYVMPTDNNPPNLPAVMAATGEKAFMLAFILADGSSCDAAWGGTAPVTSDTTVAGVINGVRSAGGDVSVSIGGYGGTKLGQVCSSAATTAAAYQAVITKYALKAIDFDLEEPEYENTTAVNNEVGAAQILQRNNSGLYVSITVPGTTSGTGYFGQNVLNTAKGLGFTPNNYSIMPFDGGFSGASSQQAALTSFNGLLTTTFGWTAANAWAHEGVSQMNGRSDTGEVFTQADFASNLSFAQSKGLGRFTFWSVNRDRQCADGADSTTSGICSSVVQGDWDFTKYDVQFAGSNPPVTTTAPPTTTTSPPSSTCSAPAYSATAVYNGGQQASYNGHLWTAKWWTQGEAPSNGGSGVWTDNGACSGSVATTAPPTTAPPTTAPPKTTAPAGGCAGLTPYSSSAVYTGGQSVSYGAHKWTAKWWTQGEAPSTGGSGVWTDNGSC